MAKMRGVLNERSSLTLTAEFFDENDAPAVPDAAEYRIHDLATGTEILGTTALPLATSVDIEITMDQNRCLTENAQETRIVTVEFDYGVGKHGTDEFAYRIKNLFGVRTQSSQSPSASPSPSA